MTNVRIIRLNRSFYVRIPPDIMTGQHLFNGSEFEMTEDGDGRLVLERQVRLRAAPDGTAWMLASMGKIKKKIVDKTKTKTTAGNSVPS